MDEPKVVITDCRYDNEVSKLLKYAEKASANIDFIWCCYPSDKYKQGLKEKHESEALAQFITQEYYYNDGDNIPNKDMKSIVSRFRKARLSKKK